MLPKVDTDLQQLAISTNVLRFETRQTIVHLLPNYTHGQLQRLSPKLSVAKPESSYA